MTEKWNGFYPEHPCKRCGNMLRGQDSGYPAELYAGTYTGLCYPCTSEKMYKVGQYLLDGAEKWSHAPVSYGRRAREVYICYPDCQECYNNKGAEIKWSQHDQYYSYCKGCYQRFESHPVRIFIHGRFKTAYRLANKIYQQNVRNFEKKYHTKKNEFVTNAEFIVYQQKEAARLWRLLDRMNEDFRDLSNRLDRFKKEF